jgi:hypothetical protein
MKNGDPHFATEFIATTPGLSATRWLAFVLGSHPDVFIAHGHFPLSSVVQTEFKLEKSKGDVDSLTIGNEMSDFYRTSSLSDVFAAYFAIKPDARAYGNIHSYTLHTLMQRVRNAAELNGINVLNVLRHPVSYIDSHFSLVRSSEQYPRLYRHYAEDVFPEAVREVPELLAMECPDYREFLAFAVSCFSVRNMARDFSHKWRRHMRMELLTTDVQALKTFCEGLTGLTYPYDRLGSFLRHGAINRHRHQGASTEPAAIYESWAPWKKNLAFIVIPDKVLETFESEGYDLDMLRQDLPSKDPRKRSLPTLFDRLSGMDESHPLAAMKFKQRRPRLNQYKERARQMMRAVYSFTK